jgi:hypothetical protein
MYTVEVLRWGHGFNKVSHTLLLQEACGLSLSQAKASTDSLLNGEVVRVSVGTQAEAEALVQRLSELRAFARVLPCVA